MKWKKLGKIFDPGDVMLPNNCKEFAQSPQALVFDDFIRIYFSTRELDSNTGKYLSHVAYIELDKSFKKILNVSDKTVIPLGELGCFDEHGIFPFNVLRDGDHIKAYTCGWSRRISVSVETATGLAVSHDNGITFNKLGSGPVFSASLHEPFLVGDSFVMKIGEVYHMWYIFGQRWLSTAGDADPERVYKIAQATSRNGIDWIRDSKPIIDDRIDQDECQALPSVIFWKGKFRMYFCYRHAVNFRNDRTRGYRIGYAYSPDLKNWTRADEEAVFNKTEDSWDLDMMCYPHIFKVDDQVFLLYNGNEFGRFGFGLAALEDK